MPCLASTNSAGGQTLPPLPTKWPSSQAEWTLFIQRAQARDQAIASGLISLGVNVIPSPLTVFDAITVPPSAITGATASLSNTARFGTSSLRLTATAATVVITLGASGYPIPIAPNGQWIGSAYVQTSGTALAGTFAIVTPAAAYSQNIGDSVQANTWNRLYDTFNLQADASTSCTVTLTFTGCAVGQTIDLEGFMLETTDGFKTLPSVFQVSSPPRTWTDIPDPGTKPANNADVTAANTSLDTAHVNGAIASSISPIATLMPAEVGANVTANHTALDTTNVAGTPAATVVNTANTANATANSLNIINLSMSQGMLGWTAAPSSEAANWYGETGGNGPNGGASTYIVHRVSGVTSTLDNTLMPCVPGQVIKAQGQCRGVGTPNGAAAMFIAFYDINKALIGSPANSNNVTGNGQFQLIVTATAPANAAFVTIGPSGGYGSGTPQGYYTFANFSWNYQPNNQSEVPNGGGHNSVTAIDGNGLALIDFTQTGHVNKTQDYIGDGPTYSRMLGSDLTGNRFDFAKGGVNKILDNIGDGSSRFAAIHTPTIQAGMFAPGANLVLNPLFALGSSYHSFGAGWLATSINGQPCAGIGMPTTATTSVSTTNSIAVTAGATLSLSIEAFLSGAGLSAGDVTADMYFSNGTSSTRLFILSAANSGFTKYTLSGVTVPTGVTSLIVRYFIEGAAASSGAFYVRRIKLEVGSTATPFSDEATQFGNQLTNAGSGSRIGDQRNLTQRTVTNYPAKVNATSSYTSTTTSATISVAAFSVLSGSVTTAYNAMSTTVSGTAGTTVTYYLYFDDPSYAGGTQTLVASTNGNDIYAGDGRVYLSSISVIFPASGAGGGGGAPPVCVCEHMFIDADTQADEARPGYLFDCLDIPTQGMRKFRRRLQSVEYATVPCVRITTDAGAVLECSNTTPFDLLGGITAYAPDMLGEQVVTDKGVETVARVDDIGEQPVCHIHLGGCSYAAGADPEHRIYSHNSTQKP